MKFEEMIPFILFGIFLIGILLGCIKACTEEAQEDIDTYGKVLSEEEEKCLNFCDGKYYFNNGGAFGSVVCKCKNDMNKVRE